MAPEPELPPLLPEKEPESVGASRSGVLNAFLALMLPLGMLVVAKVASMVLTFHVPLCMFHNLTGVPCPSCGGTRCAMAFSQGAFQQAISYHPLFFLAFMISMLGGGAYLILAWAEGRGWLAPVYCTEMERVLGRVRWLRVLLALFLLNWLYLLWAAWLGHI